MLMDKLMSFKQMGVKAANGCLGILWVCLMLGQCNFVLD